MTVQKIAPANWTDFTGGEKSGDLHLAQTALDDRQIPIGIIIQSGAAPITRKEQGPGWRRAKGMGNQQHLKVFTRGQRVTDVKLDALTLLDRVADCNRPALRVRT